MSHTKKSPWSRRSGRRGDRSWFDISHTILHFSIFHTPCQGFRYFTHPVKGFDISHTVTQLSIFHTPFLDILHTIFRYSTHRGSFFLFLLQSLTCHFLTRNTLFNTYLTHRRLWITSLARYIPRILGLCERKKQLPIFESTRPKDVNIPKDRRRLRLTKE